MNGSRARAKGAKVRFIAATVLLPLAGFGLFGIINQGVAIGWEADPIIVPYKARFGGDDRPIGEAGHELMVDGRPSYDREATRQAAAAILSLWVRNIAISSPSGELTAHPDPAHMAWAWPILVCPTDQRRKRFLSDGNVPRMGPEGNAKWYGPAEEACGQLGFFARERGENVFDAYLIYPDEAIEDMVAYPPAVARYTHGVRSPIVTRLFIALVNPGQIGTRDRAFDEVIRKMQLQAED